jgi:hypothetical protein
VVTGLLGFAAAASAQIPGMPLFTNPRYGTGIRIHADLGQPTGSGSLGNNNTVVQGGLTFALGPIGIGANVGTNFRRAQTLAGGHDTLGVNDNFTASALLQLRLLGGGVNPLAFSIFGGATGDITAQEVAAASVHYKYPRLMNFPVGGALGVHVPLGMLSFNVWGSGRMVFTKYVSCPSTDPTGLGLNTWCSKTNNDFRWAVGLDLPFLKILSFRAAYDSGKMMGVTFNSWGVGASVGLGGMR